MSQLALHHQPDEWELRRYGAAAIAIVLLHLAVIAALLVWYQRPEPAGVSIPAILVDLAPPPAASETSQQDIAPGPVMEQAEAPLPTPPKEEKIEELPPTPPQPEAIVMAPPKVEPKPEPEPVKPKPVVKEAKKPAKKPPAPRTAAPQRADRVAPDAPSTTAGASSAAAAASYRSILAAHLQRFKQYPGSARAAGEQGSTSLNFTVTRNGRVTSSRLVRRSGYASLDQETLALIQRAQPLPSFPPEMREASMNYTVPFSFTVR